MPVRYTFSGNLFRMDLEGAYTPEDVFEAYAAALDDPAFPKDARFLFDVRRSAELASRASEKIKEVAEFFAAHSEKVGNRCAIVATAPVHIGLSRMGATYAGMQGAQVKVFSSEEDALSWLGAKPEGDAG
jgi:hypothetical protein